MVYKRNPRKGLNITCSGFKLKQSIMCHFITASFFLMQNDGDVTIVYTHLVTFKHPMDMAFIHKYITKIAFAGSKETWCQPHKTRETFKYQVDMRCWHPLCIDLGTVSKYIMYVNTNRLGVLSNHVHMMSISFHEKFTLTSQFLSQTKLWWIYPELTKSCCFPDQHMESQPSHSWNSWSS